MSAAPVRPWLRSHVFTLTALVAYLASLVSTAWPLLPPWLGRILVYGLGVPAVLLVALEWSDRRPRRLQAAVLFGGGAALLLGAALMVRSGQPWWIWMPVSTAALVAATYVVGNWLAGELERSGHLIPVCVVATLADLWSALAGPTRQLGEQTAQHADRAAEQVQAGLTPSPPPMVSFLLAWWPVPFGGGLGALVGFGDLVFFALLLAAARRFELPIWRSFGLLVVGVVLSVGLSVLLARPVPALPAICVLFVLGNVGRLSLERREWLLTGAVAIGLGLVALLLALR